MTRDLQVGDKITVEIYGGGVVSQTGQESCVIHMDAGVIPSVLRRSLDGTPFVYCSPRFNAVLAIPDNCWQDAFGVTHLKEAA